MANLRDLWRRLITRPDKRTTLPFSWIWAPTLPAIGFTTRTTFAALLSLLIAMWMELDSPQWAPMTVWIVAQGSRGESLSKGRWRMFGTALGAVSAVSIVVAFPQEPWLFFPAVALWLGLCCAFATMVRNFRSYGLVLAGYTCAIIALDSINSPHDVFIIAVARTTYITLGIVCETAIGALFALNLQQHARTLLRSHVKSALDSTSVEIANILSGEELAFKRSRRLFGTILALQDQVEFAEVEMGHRGHAGDHARAALTAVSLLLSRGLGMATRMASLTDAHNIFRETSHRAADLLRTMPALLENDEGINTALLALQTLRDDCTQSVTNALAEEMYEQPAPSETRLKALLDSRVLHQALFELLEDLTQAIDEFQASSHHQKGDHFHFRLPMPNSYIEAVYNGCRAMIAVLLAALVWEVTAWPNGVAYCALVALICGLFATREEPAIATFNFFKGTVIAVLLGAVYSLYIIPPLTNYETLCAALAVPMMIGGLGMRNPATAGAAIAFELFFPNVIGPLNMGRQNEMALLNGMVVHVLAAGSAVLVFRNVLPFNSEALRQRMRGQILRDLRGLAASRTLPDTRKWIGFSTDRFSRLIRHAGPTPAPTIEAYLQGTLAALTIGLNVIRLRNVAARKKLPKAAQRPVEVVLRRMSRFTGRYGRTAAMAHVATNALRRLEVKERDMEIRLEMTRAIAYLLVISRELDENAEFLNTSIPFRSAQY